MSLAFYWSASQLAMHTAATWLLHVACILRLQVHALSVN